MTTSSTVRDAEAPIPSRTRSAVVGLVAFAGLMIITSCFALLTPLSASPDEPDHWRQAYGYWTGQAPLLFGAAEGEAVYLVPESMSGYLAQCTYQQPTVSADCLPEVGGNNLVEDYSIAKLYPPAFYASVGWVGRLFEGETALYGLRLTAAALFSALVAAAMALMFRARVNWRGSLTLMLGLTPAVYFLAGTFNPASIEVAGMALLAVIAWRCYREPTGHFGWFVALSLVAVYVALLTPLSAVMVGVALVGLTVALLPRRHWRSFGWKLTILATVLLIYLLVSLAINGAGGMYAGSESGVPLFSRYSLITTVWKGIGLPSGWVSQMGWLDTGANSLSLAAWFAAIGMLLLPILLRLRRPHWLGLLVVLGSLTLLMLFLDNYVSRAQGIPFWQARHAAPLLMVALLLVPLSLKRSHGLRLTKPVIRMTGLMVLATVVAASMMVVRYGWGPAWDGPWYPARWLPLDYNGKLTLLALFLIAFGLVIVALSPFLLLRRPPATESASSAQSGSSDETALIGLKAAETGSSLSPRTSTSSAPERWREP